MIKAVIFDMDGTMVETESIWKIVNEELAEKYGHILDQSLQIQIMGRKEDDVLQIFKEHFNLQASVGELQEVRKHILFKKLDKVTPNKGLFEFLDLLDKMDIEMAIATSSSRYFASKIIEKIGLIHRFKVFITGDEIIKGKPDPEIFLTAAKRLGVSASECLVLEDAQNGVEAAFNAKMKVFAIPHEYSRQHDLSKATKILNSMLDINRQMIKEAI